tara:strand:+ start:674 stop:877 length:204 start_codon:yes stop_codon:yes gene_type:complete
MSRYTLQKYPGVSRKLLVLESAGGFYIGRVYYHDEEEYEPYSRESCYYASEEVAQEHLDENTYIEVL